MATYKLITDRLNTYFTNNKITIGTAAPTSGTHAKGDLVLSSSANSTSFGWICTAAGTPGTWKVLKSGSDVTLSSLGAAASSHTHSYLPLAGGTLTGDIKFNMNGYTGQIFDIFGSNEYGHGVNFGGSGMTIVSAGESGSNLITADSLVDSVGTERLYLTSDTDIHFYTNCNTIDNRKYAILNSSLYFYPSTAATGAVGHASYPWLGIYGSNMYLYGSDTKYYGSLKAYTEGTTDTIGSARLYLGNSTASGTAGNAAGSIVMYGSNTGYTWLHENNATTANLNIYLPSASGTLALTDNTVAKGNGSAENLTVDKYLKFGDYDDDTVVNTFLRDGTWNTGFTDITLSGGKSVITEAGGDITSGTLTMSNNINLNWRTGAEYTNTSTNATIASGTALNILDYNASGNLHLGSGILDNSIETGSTYITGGLDISLRTVGDGTIHFRPKNASIMTVSTSAINAAKIINAKAGLSVTGNTTIAGNIVGDAALTRYLGTASLPWAATYAKQFSIYGEASKVYGYANAYTLGTTSTVGEGRLVLGNSTASGTASNAKGGIFLYGNNTGGTYITPGNNTADSITITLPSAAGTLATTANLNSYLPLAGGTMTGHITLNNGKGIYGKTASDITDTDGNTVAAGTTSSILIYNSAHNLHIGALINEKNLTVGSTYINGAENMYLRTNTGQISFSPAGTNTFIIKKDVTVTNKPINTNFKTGTYLAGNQGTAMLNSTAAAGEYVTIAKTNSTNGYFTLNGYQAGAFLSYTAKTTVDAGTNSVTKTVKLLDESGGSAFPGNVTFDGYISSTGVATKNCGTTANPWLGVVGKNLYCYGTDEACYGSMRTYTEGTTETQGDFRIYVGNNKAAGTAGNARGRLVMYGTNTGYTWITPGYNDTGNITITLPSVGGTLARTDDNVASATKLKTARTISLGGYLTGSASFDGSGNVTITAGNNREPVSGAWFSNGFSTIRTDGVMEVGSMLDFHQTNTTTKDYSVRLQCSSDGGTTVVLPSKSGTLAVMDKGSTSYWGLNPEGSSWIRTPSAGLLPYDQTGTSSSLGTSSWKFGAAHIADVNADKVWFSTARLQGADGGIASTKRDGTAYAPLVASTILLGEYSGATHKLSISASAPSSPATGDIWIDI